MKCVLYIGLVVANRKEDGLSARVAMKELIENRVNLVGYFLVGMPKLAQRIGVCRRARERVKCARCGFHHIGMTQ